MSKLVKEMDLFCSMLVDKCRNLGRSTKLVSKRTIVGRWTSFWATFHTTYSGSKSEHAQKDGSGSKTSRTGPEALITR